MNVTRKDASAQIAEITIELARADYEGEVKKSIKEYQKKVEIPGFRKGHAPMGLVEKKMGKQLLAEEVNKQLMVALNKYIKENNIMYLCEPLLAPNQENMIVDGLQDYSFTFQLALYPEFELNYAKMPETTMYEVVASDEEVDENIEINRRRLGEVVTPETVEEDSMVECHIQEVINGEPVEGGVDRNTNIFLNRMNKKGKKLFVGKKKDDTFVVDIRTLFNKDQESAVHAVMGKKVEAEDNTTIKVTIMAISRVILAEMNEEFFKKLFPDGNVKNEKELRERMRENLKNYYKAFTEKMFDKKASDVLVEKTKMNLPLDFIKRYTAETMGNKEISDEDLIKSVKWQLIEQKIVKDNNIQISQDDVKAYIKDMFRKNYFGAMEDTDGKMDATLDSLVESVMKSQEDVQRAYNELYNEKLSQVIIANMPAKTKAVTIKEFSNLMSK